jgi:LDH2 family malate/lactate/ureidoglycolate dehydrogenase
MPGNKTRTENVEFIEYCIERVFTAAGASQEHAAIVARAIGFAHRQGGEKLNQGLGVYEVLDIALISGNLDVKAEPELVNEGPSWAVFDGHKSSGYYVLDKMARCAIGKAKQHAIAIAFGANHNDAGSFSAFAHMAYEEDLVAFTSNNTPPLTAPYGGMSNALGAPPFDAIIPGGRETPLWASVKFAEFYDGDVAEAVLQNKPMKGKWLIDPETGELTDQAEKHAKPFEGYGRIWDYDWGGQIENPRTYALNLWNEGMTAVINPLGIPVCDIPNFTEFVRQKGQTSVGGSYYLCIDPSHFGPIEKVKERSDRLVRAIHAVKPRPGQSVRLPGENGFKKMRSGDKQVQVLDNHWEPFFTMIAGRYGLSEDKLRKEFAARKA